MCFAICFHGIPGFAIRSRTAIFHCSGTGRSYVASPGAAGSVSPNVSATRAPSPIVLIYYPPTTRKTQIHEVRLFGQGPLLFESHCPKPGTFVRARVPKSRGVGLGVRGGRSERPKGMRSRLVEEEKEKERGEERRSDAEIVDAFRVGVSDRTVLRSGSVGEPAVCD